MTSESPKQQKKNRNRRSDTRRHRWSSAVADPCSSYCADVHVGEHVPVRAVDIAARAVLTNKAHPDQLLMAALQRVVQQPRGIVARAQ